MRRPHLLDRWLRGEKDKAVCTWGLVPGQLKVTATFSCSLEDEQCESDITSCKEIMSSIEKVL